MQFVAVSITVLFFMSNQSLVLLVLSNFVDGDQTVECMKVSWTNQWIWTSLGSCIVCWGVLLIHRHFKSELMVWLLEIVVAAAALSASGMIVAHFSELI